MPAGLLLPSSVLESEPLLVLAAFVALNTMMYVVISVARTLPKLYASDWLPRRHARRETRSIHPDGPI